MSIKVTNKTIKVHTEFFDFMPRWSLEKAEYEKAKVTSIDEKPQSRFKPDKQNSIIRMAGDIGEPLDHWPREAAPGETSYYAFLDKISDSDTNKFHPAREGQHRTPVKGTGAFRYVTDLLRLRRGDGSEFLITKSYIVGYDAAGEEKIHYVPFAERWIKTIFDWRNEYNNSRKTFERICFGPKDVETIYTLEFNQKNAKELFDQRPNDININFIVKDEVSDEAREVAKDVNAVKTLERFSNNTFEFLWTGEYIPLPVRQELRQEAVARGYIKGGASDFQAGQPADKGGKNAYQ